MFKLLCFSVLFLFSGSCSSVVTTSGLDNVPASQAVFKGKRIGIIGNQTSVDSRGQSIVTVFKNIPGVTIGVLFGPEHGFRGTADAGAKVTNSRDPLAGVPVYSLYGTVRKPTPEMLKNIDMLVFDIQDIGTRYYTYISTMALAMEAAAENHIPFIVLDRPNPINGITVEGSVLDTAFASFVGKYPVAVRHGMTIGEMARLINGEGWLANHIKADLTVIRVKNWHREEWYDETGLSFIKPSPNMPDLETAALYPGMCLLEGTNVSEGRGSLLPFKIFGAPWIDGPKLTDRLNRLQLPGIVFRDTVFTPRSISGMSANPKYKNKTCNGCRVYITNRKIMQPFYSGLSIVAQIRQSYPDSLRFRTGHFDRLCGTDKIRKTIQAGNLNRLKKLSALGVDDFKALRRLYLLY